MSGASAFWPIMICYDKSKLKSHVLSFEEPAARSPRRKRKAKKKYEGSEKHRGGATIRTPLVFGIFIFFFRPVPRNRSNNSEHTTTVGVNLKPGRWAKEGGGLFSFYFLVLTKKEKQEMTGGWWAGFSNSS